MDLCATTSVGSAIRERAETHLARALGKEQGGEALRVALERTNRTSISSADDLLAIAEQLVTEGGIVGRVGRSLKTHAMLLGAPAR